MESDYVSITLHLLAALTAGGLIGLERTYHGRPAGFRTHTLVCTASSLLMLLTVHQLALLPDLPIETVRVDPTRMAQGIMTGIGFLGAGVIMKEGLSIRGLTTAASIWMTASIGILIGVGFYFPAVVTTLLTLMTLSLFRWIEAIMPIQSNAHLRASFSRERYVTEDALDKIIREHGISSSGYSYRLAEGGNFFEYQMSVRSRDPKNFRRLADTLTQMESVKDFAITPAGEK
jgi:putative Mg2+ transporter-C (MgtC) family protein